MITAMTCPRPCHHCSAICNNNNFQVMPPPPWDNNDDDCDIDMSQASMPPPQQDDEDYDDDVGMPWVMPPPPQCKPQWLWCWWNTSKAASTLGYLKRLLGPLGKWREGIESALEGNSKRIRLGMPVDSLAFIYYHTVCTCLYQIYQYCLGQA